MKNLATQLSAVLIVFIALTFLMSYTRPAEEAPKQYMLVYKRGAGGLPYEEFQQAVNQKISEGWRVQGGMTADQSVFIQAMVK